MLKCPCVVRTDLEKHRGCLFICADGTHWAGYRPSCLSTQECPMDLASQLALTSGASPGLSWPCSVFSTSGFSLVDFTQSSIPGLRFVLSLPSLCQVCSHLSGSCGKEWCWETPLGGRRPGSILWLSCSALQDPSSYPTPVRHHMVP